MVKRYILLEFGRGNQFQFSMYNADSMENKNHSSVIFFLILGQVFAYKYLQCEQIHVLNILQCLTMVLLSSNNHALHEPYCFCSHDLEKSSATCYVSTELEMFPSTSNSRKQKTNIFQKIPPKYKGLKLYPEKKNKSKLL